LKAYKEAKDDFNTICWESQGSAKIVLAVDNLDQLLKYFDMAKDNQINTCIIKDAGRTQIDAGTITVCAIGPAKNEQIDLITGKLSLL
jgi:PTH2 family peptidyl-tRNA hydrolase